MASLKRQLEFSQMQVVELQQVSADDAKCRSQMHGAEINIEQRLEVSQFMYDF